MAKNREQGSKVAPLAVLLFGLNKPERNIIFRGVTSQANMLGVSHKHKARGWFRGFLSRTDVQQRQRRHCGSVSAVYVWSYCVWRSSFVSRTTFQVHNEHFYFCSHINTLIHPCFFFFFKVWLYFMPTCMSSNYATCGPGVDVKLLHKRTQKAQP